ncbi:MAG TPA: polysaccharide lyase [Haloferula sp.]
MFPLLAAILSILPLGAEQKRGTVIYDGEGYFRDDFRSGSLAKWGLSEDKRYNLEACTPGRIDIVDAPGLPAGTKAVRFTVPRAPNTFRAEISTRHEEGFQERWFSQRILIPGEWTPEFKSKGNDIVMQWHGIPGNGRPTHPNLEISIGRDKWFVRQSFGSAREPQRVNKELDEKVVPGQWVSWVIHAKWSPEEAGSIRIWKDAKLVFEANGPNVYGDIGVEYSPYLKTGIYHPEWNLDRENRRLAFDREEPQSLLKVVYVTDVKVARGDKKFEDMDPDGRK